VGASPTQGFALGYHSAAFQALALAAASGTRAASNCLSRLRRTGWGNQCYPLGTNPSKIGTRGWGLRPNRRNAALGYLQWRSAG